MAIAEILFFDIDDTVLDFTSGERSAVGKALSECGVNADKDTISLYHEINKDCWRKMETGEYTRDEVLKNRFSRLFSELGIAGVSSEYVNDVYAEYLSHESSYIPGAQSVLQKLKGRYPMYGLSNGNTKIQRTRCRLSGLQGYFEEIFISEEVGYNKPDRRFFDYCIEKIGNPEREKILMIGDSVTSDIKGGKNAGILTCLVTNGASVRGEAAPDYIINEIGELPILLGNMIKPGTK